jgi:hypothetical protein
MIEDELRETISAFAKLTPSERAIVLARFAFELTIVARDTYVLGSEQMRYPERLRALNEIQHRVTRRILDILLQRGWEGADEYVWEQAFEQAEEAGCADYVRYAYQRSVSDRS